MFTHANPAKDPPANPRNPNRIWDLLALTLAGVLLVALLVYGSRALMLSAL